MVGGAGAEVLFAGLEVLEVAGAAAGVVDDDLGRGKGEGGVEGEEVVDQGGVGGAPVGEVEDPVDEAGGVGKGADVGGEAETGSGIGPGVVGGATAGGGGAGGGGGPAGEECGGALAGVLE